MGPGRGNSGSLMLYEFYACPVFAVDDDATLDNLRAAVATLEEIGPIARRVLGGAHPHTEGMDAELQNARAALRARETPSTSA